ncbi:MAG: fibronectin type III domain-containing protein [Pseudomonadota bacterium]
MALAWAASTAPSVSGYRLYYGTASGSYLQPKGSGIATGNTTTYTVNNLTSKNLYYFAVTAIDANGNESAYSNEASKLIP